jgi:hypothetical protein
MSHSTLTGKQPIALAIPAALLPTMYVAFQAGGTRFGYLVAFLIYWMDWCILLPTFLLRGSHGLLDLFRDGLIR